MKYFQVDPRDGGSSSLVGCNTCCCQSVTMQPGITDQIMIDYAPWSIPIAPPGIVAGGFSYTVEHITATCDTSQIDGVGPPTNINYFVVADPDTAVIIDLSTNQGPDPEANWVYSIVPLTGPTNGTLTLFDANGSVTYTPNPGYRGVDYFSYKLCDDHGRCIIRTVQVTTTSNIDDVNQQANLDRSRMVDVPYIQVDKVKVDQNYQRISFPVHMPISCRPCDLYRVTIQQKARDCDGNIYVHQMCLDFTCKNC